MPRPRRGRRFQTAKLTGPTSCTDCQARIVYIKMDATGKHVPVDPIPDDTGTVCGRLVGNELQGYVVSKDRPHQRPYTRYVAHYATCSDRTRPVSKPPVEDPLALFDLEDR